MGLLMLLRRLYSLDTLDTRFTASATAPLGAANSNQHAGETRQTKNSTATSQWNTPEFYAYYVVFLLAVPLMFKSAIDVSKESHPSYSKYSARLSTGWIPGRKVDNSDLQYASFRDNIPYMALLLVIHPLLRRVCAYFWPMVSAESSLVAPDKSHSGSGFTSLVAATARFEQRVSFDYWFALLFLVALHGFSAFKVLGILMVNYAMIRRLPRVYIPASTWMFNIGILFANELLHGYKYASITSFVVSLLGLGKESGLVTWGEWLDSWGGLVSRWEVLFNITVLRLISFNLDYYWSLDFRAGSPVEKQLDPSNLSERDRIATPAKQAYFNVRNYLAYALYSPLYLAGPIVTFNDYVHQQQYRPPSVSRSRTLLYGIRFLLTLLCMELILHYIYVVAISKSSPNWSIYTPFQLSMLGYFNLHIIWLKLLIPWRFFRLWALIDGIDPPENMVRCMSDNYSALAFWRSWHRSFNRWVVRYLYVPLGGSRNEQGQNTLSSKVRGIFNFLVVFTFVALWHDINLRLLMWGWLVTLFVLPEIIASMLFPAHKWRSEPTKYRIICGIGAVGNILMMMAANLVGFALGLDGLQGLLSGILGSYAGVAYLMGACSAVFVAVQVMFEIREGELRAGIRLKC